MLIIRNINLISAKLRFIIVLFVALKVNFRPKISHRPG